MIRVNLADILPIHKTITTNMWHLMLWDDDAAPYLKHDQSLNDNLDTLIAEMAATDCHTTVEPLKVVVGHSLLPSPLIWQRKLNILTNDGLAEMAKRNASLSSTTNSHHAIGTGSTSPGTWRRRSWLRGGQEGHRFPRRVGPYRAVLLGVRLR